MPNAKNNNTDSVNETEDGRVKPPNINGSERFSKANNRNRERRVG